MGNYQELDVWKMAIELTKGVYKLTAQLPKEELFGLSSQARRAAVSIPSNIAEGQGRNNRKEYAQFVGIAYGSHCELETLLLLCQEVHQLEDETVSETSKRVGSMLWRLRESLRSP